MNRTTAGSGALDGLVRILQQEKRLGYQDRAVFGGLDRFLESWATKVRVELGDGPRCGQAIATVAPLRPYSSLDSASREVEIERALRALAQLNTPSGADNSPAASPARPGSGAATKAVRGNIELAADNVGAAGERRGGSRTAPTRGQSSNTIENSVSSAAARRTADPRNAPQPPTWSFAAAHLENSGDSPADAGSRPSGKMGPDKARLSATDKPKAKIETPRMPATPSSCRAKGLLTLDSSIRALDGVGASFAAKLERLGVATIKDLLYLFPRRHLNYSVMKRIKDLTVGDMESVLGTVWEIKTSRAKSGLPVITATVADETGTIQVIWFNQPHLVKMLSTGRQVVLSGRIEQNLGRPLLKSPDWELLEAEDLTHTGRLVPVYPLTEGLSGRWLRALIKRTLNRWVPELQEHLPKSVRELAHLMDIQSAISQVHFPDNQQLFERAQQRLIFDELFLIHLGMMMRKQKWREGQPGNPFTVDEVSLETFTASLPFQLTGAQRRALGEILADLQLSRPMTRLLQGDVGSGKTVVATAAMMVAWSNGFQSVLMAPTEILAEQHFKTISQLVESYGERSQRGRPSVRLLKGAVKKAEKDEVHRGLDSGEIDIVVGTQAIIQEGVSFKRLGLAIADEQHRFGVMQRAILRQKGYNPHVLVMTATPIPRTLALTLYGDLDISAIDELPPGRQEIKTYLLGAEHRQRAYDFVRKQVKAGRQSFVICPLIEESDKIEAKAATAEYERLRTRIFPDLKLGLLHGKMRAQDKDAVMDDFRQGRTDVLVSTPVVEVGIDIPNATVMLIEGADRFGLAQLHQFRGRVGRGTEKSYCLLLADSPSVEAEERLQVITRNQDGFTLAEEDLRLRGPGEFFGTRQSGMPDLKIAKLGDLVALERARNAASQFFTRDPDLREPEHKLLAQQVVRFWQIEGEPN